MTHTVLLVHSPLVGPATWRPVADQLRAAGRHTIVPSLLGVATAPRPRWRFAVDTAVAAAAPTAARDDVRTLVVVGHSGAGLLLPAIGAAVGSRLSAYVFVDAALPPPSGHATAEPAFVERMRALSTEGLLPPWSQWWGRDIMTDLVPDSALRAEIDAELPRLPIDYYEDPILIPSGWDAARVAYLQFSPAYERQSQEARERGFIVDRLEGGHLHMAVEPQRVADTVRRLIEAS
jgi:hypothetical protein